MGGDEAVGGEGDCGLEKLERVWVWRKVFGLGERGFALLGEACGLAGLLDRRRGVGGERGRRRGWVVVVVVGGGGEGEEEEQREKTEERSHESCEGGDCVAGLMG